MTIERGSVYWVEFGEEDDEDDEERTGYEQAGNRPGIIMQNNDDNRSLDTTIVVPTTCGSADDASHLNTIFISSADECFPKDSVALCAQVRTIDVADRLEDKIGELSRSKLRELEAGLQSSLKLY